MKKGVKAKRYVRVQRSGDGLQKVCSKCDLMKPLEDFPKGKARPDGRHYWCRPCHTAQNKLLNDGVKLEVFRHYSKGDPKCACCGETNVLFLTMDHVDGDGSYHRKTLKLASGSSTYYWLRRNGYPDGFQVLCWNCQHGKFVYGVCPHQTLER